MVNIFDGNFGLLVQGTGGPGWFGFFSRQGNYKYGRRVRKVFGGGMRQAGFLAAAGIYALEPPCRTVNNRSFTCSNISRRVSQMRLGG